MFAWLERTPHSPPITPVGPESFLLDEIEPRESISQVSVQEMSTLSSKAHSAGRMDVDNDTDEEQDILSLVSGVSSKKRRRGAEGLGFKHFSDCVVKNKRGEEVPGLYCLLCRERGKDFTYIRKVEGTSARLRHMKMHHTNLPEVQEVYPELARLGAHKGKSQASSAVQVQGRLTPEYSKQALLEHLVCLIAGDNLPLRLVESPYLCALVALLSKGARRDMPTDSSMGDSVQEVYSKVRIVTINFTLLLTYFFLTAQGYCAQAHWVPQWYGDHCDRWLDRLEQDWLSWYVIYFYVQCQLLVYAVLMSAALDFRNR